jgi:LPS export ABC transporter protein LptC
MGRCWHGFFTRRRFRVGLGLLLIVLVGAVAVQLALNQWTHRLGRLRGKDLDFLPHVAQRIQNFRRVKMEGGRKAWEVAAREAQYLEDDQQIVVDDPEVSLYLKGEEGAISLRGRAGKIFLSGREIDRVELDGAIEVRFRDYRMTTDRAVYEHASDTVVSPGAVRVTGTGLALSGARMTLEVETQRVRVDGRVETVLRRDQVGADGAGAL